MLARVLRDCRATGAIEFALVTPALLMFLFGTFQVGIILMADSGMKSAVGEAARYATIYPTPTDAQIKTRVTDSKFGLNKGTLPAPTVVRGKSGSQEYVDITLTYTHKIDPILTPSIPVTLTETRRAWLQVGN